MFFIQGGLQVKKGKEGVSTLLLEKDSESRRGKGRKTLNLEVTRLPSRWIGWGIYHPRGKDRRSAAGLDQLKPLSLKTRLATYLSLLLLSVVVCGILDQRGFQFFEQFPYNLRAKVYTSRHQDLIKKARESIVLIEINEETIANLNLPGPPIPRNYHARVIQNLQKLGAKVIAFDLVFDLPSSQDRDLAASAKAFGNVLWACVFLRKGSNGQRLLLPVPSLRSASNHWGHINLSFDADTTVADCIEPFLLAGKTPVPAFSLQAVLMALGKENLPVHRVPGGWKVGENTYLVDQHGGVPVLFLGKPSREDFISGTFHVIPYEAVYGLSKKEEFLSLEPSIKDKIVIIGDNTTVGNDHRITPVGDMWGPEIHAHAMSTFLQRGTIRHVSGKINLLVLFLLSLAIWPITSFYRLGSAVLSTFVLLLGYIFLNYWLFVDKGIWVNIIGPSIGLLLTSTSIMVFRAWIEEREKKRAQGLLQRYVSPQIAEYVIAHPEKCFLGGEKVVATVLFSDIRGFTAMSEKLSPEQVVARLNEYLQAMTDRVFQHDGAVDKYVGDAIMALFGIPVPYPDHPRRAVACALDMQSALMELQAKWKAEGLPIIDIGIGINTGEMVVGNIGSKDRLDFTVIGDAVNTASRVESLNKDLHTRILITAATYEHVKEEVEARGPIQAYVKGKEEPIIIYEVLGWREGQSPFSEGAQEALKTSQG